MRLRRWELQATWARPGPVCHSVEGSFWVPVSRHFTRAGAERAKARAYARMDEPVASTFMYVIRERR